MLAYNVDRSDEKRGTSYPFTTDSTLMLSDAEIPPMTVLSLKVYYYEDAVLPLRISRAESVDTTKDYCNVYITDSSGSDVAVWHAYIGMAPYAPDATSGQYGTAFLLSPKGAVAGFITCDVSLPSTISAIVDRNSGSVKFSKNAFKILPYCCIPYFAGNARVISIDGNATTSDVDIYPGTYCKVFSAAAYKNKLTRSTSLFWSLTGPYETPVEENGICQLQVNCLKYFNGTKLTPSSTVFSSPVWLGGKHLVVKSGVASNLRILVDNNNNSIRLHGVQDA